MREFGEETGMQAQAGSLLDVTEIIRPEKPWHSITVTFLGHLTTPLPLWIAHLKGTKEIAVFTRYAVVPLKGVNEGCL
jgi:ADP-ribose pyrophosphatase YjhB (NUDIX family)